MKALAMSKPMSEEAVKREMTHLKASNQTMILATQTAEGVSETSYAPYVCIEQKYYIILSKIATHYENIERGKVFQGMILEDEQSAVNTFFRKRIILNLQYVSTISEQAVISAFVENHGVLAGKVLEMDFNIFELKTVDGRVILGPGQAFRLSNEEEVLEQITTK